MMNEENSVQPFEALMTKLALTNAQLVIASTEQLSFKMVQKARKGKVLSPNIQKKILNALAVVKPDLKVKPRDIFPRVIARSDSDEVPRLRSG